jgi:hypothetical protein
MSSTRTTRRGRDDSDTRDFGPDDEVKQSGNGRDHGTGMPKPSDYQSSCQPIDLTPYLNGDIKPVQPTLGRRSDGVCLLYRGKMHALVGESEAGKTWLALLWCADEIRAGHDVLFIDCEDDPEGITERLLALGLTAEQILEHFSYIRPETMLDMNELTRRAARCTLTILDGITEAMFMASGSTESRDWNMGWVAFLTGTLRPIAATGTALGMIDHPNRADGKEPARHASGAGHKLRGLNGAQYILHSTEPCGRGLQGSVKVYVTKDRKGHLRQHGMFIGGRVQMTQIATMTVDDRSETGSRTIVTLDPPVAGEFRPTTLMAWISQAAASEPDGTWLSKNKLAGQVTGTKAYLLKAIDLLAAEGYLATQQTRSDRIVYQHAKMFKEPF